jgi:hypothetical protein
MKIRLSPSNQWACHDSSLKREMVCKIRARWRCPPPTMVCNRSQSLCQGKKPMQSYNPLPSSTRASKSPLPGGGRASERAALHARIVFVPDVLAPSGTSPGNVLAPAVPALSHRTAKSGSAMPSPTRAQAERGMSSFHFFKTVDPLIQPVSHASYH